MNHSGKFISAVSTACIAFLTCTAIAQDNSNLPYIGRYTISIGGGQPGTGVASIDGNCEVKGQIVLPE
jgi:hypothetical protein